MIFAFLLLGLLLLLTSQARAGGSTISVPTVEKSVIGPVVLDLGEELTVRLGIMESSGGDVEFLKLTDYFPKNFAVKNVPGGCTVDSTTNSGILSCDLVGMRGNITFEYSLLASSKGRRLLFDHAVLNYQVAGGGGSGVAVSNDVTGEYAVGSFAVNMTDICLSVNGAKVQPATVANVLPHSVINLSFSLLNSGSVETSDAIFVTLSLPADWMLLSTGSLEFVIPALAAGAALPYSFRILTPLHSDFVAGEAVMTVSTRIGVMDGENAQTTNFEFFKVAPNIRVEREVWTEWKMNANDPSDSSPPTTTTASSTTPPHQVLPVLYVRHTVQNLGTALAIVSLDQNIPDELDAVNHTGKIVVGPDEFTVDPASSVVLEYFGLVPESVETVLLPRTYVSFEDALGNAYDDLEITIDAETVGISKTIWVRIFNATNYKYPLIPVISTVVFALCIFGAWWGAVRANKGTKSYLILACTALGLVALAIVVSAVRVTVL